MDIHSRVREVATELVSEGIWPTVQEIRARLGSGSNTTINNTLRQWRQGLLSQMATTARHPDWSPALAQAFNQLWQQACTEADNNLAKQRSEAKAEVERLISELASASREQESLAANLQALTQQQQTLQAALAAETANNTALRSEQATLAAELAKARAERDIAHEQLQQANERAITQDSRHEHELQQRQVEADRREALAYERVEGVRHQLYQQLEDERASMRKREQQWQQSLQQLTAQADSQREANQRQLATQAQENGRLAAEREALQTQLSTSMTELAIWQQRHAEQAITLAEHQAVRQQLQQAQTLFHEHRLPHLLLWLQARQSILADMPSQTLADEIRQLLAS